MDEDSFVQISVFLELWLRCMNLTCETWMMGWFEFMGSNFIKFVDKTIGDSSSESICCSFKKLLFFVYLNKVKALWFCLDILWLYKKLYRNLIISANILNFPFHSSTAYKTLSKHSQFKALRPWQPPLIPYHCHRFKHRKETEKIS